MFGYVQNQSFPWKGLREACLTYGLLIIVLLLSPFGLFLWPLVGRALRWPLLLTLQRFIQNRMLETFPELIWLMLIVLMVMAFQSGNIWAVGYSVALNAVIGILYCTKDF